MKGIGASPGIAIGRVLIKNEQKVEIVKKAIDNPQDEIKKLTEAREIAKQQVKKLHQLALKNMGEEEANIFEAHMMIIDDPEFFSQVEDKVSSDNVNVDWALKQVSDFFIDMFANMDNEYMRERAADIKDITGRIMKILLGIEITDFTNLEEEVIIVARDLTPSDTASMDKNKVIGFVTEIGGRTSHSAIMARTLEIPAVVGLDGILSQVKNGDSIVFDGDKGEVHVNPSQDIVDEAKATKEEYDKFQKMLRELVGKPSVSKDGVRVELAGNIGTPNDLEGVIRNDAEGIGLYRTEFLYMDREKLPTEDEQFEAYKAVLEGLNGKPVVIRTLDIGGDKKLSYMEMPEEMNPFLGYRAIRLCLDKVGIFKTQLRALFRASVHGNLRIMFPMISSIEELRKAKAIVEEVKDELRKEGIKYSDSVQIGMMIEIPATAILSDMFAKEVDFFSIGTNDLIQYTTAVDRMNQKISHLYNQFHPALLRLIKMTIENGHKEGIWVGMCGEVAGDPKLIPILLGFGLDEFSMSPISILKARHIIKNISKEEMKEHAQKVVMLPTAEDVKKYIDENIK
ncbi:phosphoenolpyruvate--protein phosphotransferase [Abyssisolibacter fermentans]|uniref:phosphoenolpyruvate--protein phosphotransferase n=1 Tax=Abyssisolibacter fermentans TaxID=1766203 RepID=UPI00082F4224|nr:phosphoenolpyruvate--protein phosphotransferase [Abyssisolibacter fermentans]